MKTPAFYASLVAGLTLLFAPPVYAQDAETTAVEKEQAAKPAGPAMWKAYDADTTIYLFGTVHFLPPEVQWLSDDIETAIASADLIVEELGPDAETPTNEDQMKIGQMALLTPPATLRGMMSEDDRKIYEAEMVKLGIDPAAYDSFQPWFASLQMVVAKFGQIGFAADSGVESVLATKAPGTPRLGLETLVYQFGLFASLRQDSQVQYLMEAAKSMDDIKPALKGMVDLWLAGDAEGLATMMNESVTEAEVAETLLYKRNANWTDWIAKRLETPGTVFMAVGAGHLAGEKSVQDLLKKRKIKVERVR